MTREQAGPHHVWIWFILGLAVLLTGLLIGPRVPAHAEKPTCVGNVDLPGPFGFGLNCDSPQFTWLARDPAGLLEPENARQARPGLILIAALLQKPLALVAPPTGPPRPAESGLSNPEEISASLPRDLPAYLAYILLNIGLLAASFWLLRKVLEGYAPIHRGLVISAGLLLVANDVTKAFAWSPHTQMFNILVPVAAVYASLAVWSGALASRRFALGLGSAVGLGLTAYPAVVIIPICCLLPALRIARESTATRWRSINNLVLLLALSALPSAAWYVFVRHTTGAFFHFEMAQGEVVWMSDAWRQGGAFLLQKWFSHAGELIVFAVPQVLPAAALAILVAWVMWRERVPFAALRPVLPVLVAAFYVSAAVLGFYASVGWIVDRLAYPIVPPLLLAAATSALAVLPRLSEPGRQMLVRGSSLLAFAQISYVIVKDGPWS